MNTLCSANHDTSTPDPDHDILDHLISATVYVQREDYDDKAENILALTSRAQLVRDWCAARLAAPHLRVDIKEACVDETQHKVWVRSEVSGLPGGVRKESIDMMTFSEDGVLVGCLECRRILGRRRREMGKGDDLDESEDEV